MIKGLVAEIGCALTYNLLDESAGLLHDTNKRIAKEDCSK